MRTLSIRRRAIVALLTLPIVASACDNPTNIEPVTNIAFVMRQNPTINMGDWWPAAAVLDKTGTMTLEDVQDGTSFMSNIDPATQNGHYGYAQFLDLGTEDSDADLSFAVKKYTASGTIPFNTTSAVIGYQVLRVLTDPEYGEYLEPVGEFASLRLPNDASTHRIVINRQQIGVTSQDYLVLFAVAMPGTEFNRIGSTQMTGDWSYVANTGQWGAVRGSVGAPLVGYADLGPVYNRTGDRDALRGMDLVQYIYNQRSAQ